MSKHVKIALGILTLGVVAIVGGKFALPLLDDFQQTDTSDARDTKGKITIGYDNWVGYFPLCSPEMKKRLRQSGYLLECVDDNADYSERYKKLADGKYDFAVGTVDSYLVNGAAQDYPGVIAAVIDESKGGDAIVAWEDKVASLDDLKSDKNLKIAFTPASPSDHLLKAISVHFDIPNLRNRRGWPIETDGSSQALQKLLKKESDVSVLWEPDVSKALAQSGIKRILGTEDTNQLIVDILLVNRRFSSKNPDVVDIVLRHYFRTLKHYRDNESQLIDDVANASDLKKDSVKALLNGVQWASLTDNAQRWYGVVSTSLPEEALIDTIDSTLEILTDYGDFSRNPIPNNDPYRLTNSSFVKRLFEKTSGSNTFGQAGANNANNVDYENSLSRSFDTLSAKNWAKLREIGTLKIRPIVFASGTHSLTLDGKSQLDAAAENLKHYPNYRLEIRGHTGLRGDKKQNKALSADRADAVKRYINITYGVDSDRMRSLGFGSERPLAKNSGESSRAYNYRLPRVELILVAEEL